jgi:hypothetical protein
MKLFLWLSILVGIGWADTEVSAHDLLCQTMSDTSPQAKTYSGAIENLKRAVFYGALDTAIKTVPSIKIKLFKSTDSGKVLIKYRGRTRDMYGTAQFLASKKSPFGKYKKFRRAYLNSILWNIRFPSFIQNELLEILMVDLYVKGLPEYNQTVAKAKAHETGERCFDAEALARFFLRHFNVNSGSLQE